MTFPAELKYTKSHEWVKEFADGTAWIGISDYAQAALGDLVFVNLPEVGDEITAGETFADVESVKAVSDVYSPVSGSVCEINEDLMDAPGTINETPYEAWFVKVENITEKSGLLSADEYSAYVETLD